MELGMFAPLVLLALALGWVFWNRQRMRKTEAQHSDKRAGAVAARMGLSVVRGDPNLSLLYFQQPSGDYERSIEMSGRPYGRAVRFSISDSQKTNEYLVAREVTHSFGCRLAVEFHAAPVFEVVLRRPNQYLTAPQDHAQLPLTEIATGVAHLDAQFIVRAEHPRLGPALVDALLLLSSHAFVHLAGGADGLWISVHRLALPYVASAAEEFVLALETAACALEGKPAPGRLPVRHGASPVTAPPAAV